MKYFKFCVDEIQPISEPYPITIDGINFVAHKDNEEWKVTEVTTGLLLVQKGISKEEVIKKAQEFISKTGIEKIKSTIKIGYEENKELIDNYTTPHIKTKVVNVMEI